MQADLKYTLTLAGILVVFFGGVAASWLSGHASLYFAIMHVLGVDAFSRPFLDLSGVLAMGQCHRLGIDPTLPSPCDPLHRILPYGPIILHEPFATADVNWLGILQSVLFLSAVPLVLRPRTRTQLVIMTGASISSSVLYALERGNFDLIEFLLVVVGVFIAWRGLFGRLGSYLLFFAGGTAKFYPFALLLTMARERFVVAIGLAAVSFAAIVTYMLASRSILAKLSAAVPFAYNGGVFGATCLPFGLVDWLALPRYAGYLLMAALITGFGLVGWRTAKRLYDHFKPAGLETPNFQLLLVGAIVLASCFFTGTSISYRGIFLLLLLPGLFDLARIPEMGRWGRLAIAASLLCLWSELIRRWGESGINRLLDMMAPERENMFWDEAPSMIFFVARELLWWWLVAVMSAIVGFFLVRSRVSREIRHTPLPRLSP